MKDFKRYFRVVLGCSIIFLVLAIFKTDLFHFTIMGFIIFIGILIYIVALNSDVYSERRLLLTIAVIYIYVTVFNFFQMMTLENIEIFEMTRNMRLQYWSSARTLELFAYISIYFTQKKNIKINSRLTHVSLILYTGIMIRLISHSELLLPLYENGEYTVTAYILEAIMLSGYLIAILLISRIEIKPIVKKLIILSLSLKFVATLFNSLIFDFEQSALIVSQFFILYSYLTMYLVFINETIKDPYQKIEDKYKDETEALKFMAEHDSLTGIYNHTTTYKKADALIDKYKDTDQIAVILLDIDDFKKVNDTYGHQKGDIILKAFADLLMACETKEKVVGRYGGDEFVVVCAGTTKEEFPLKFKHLHTEMLKLNQKLGVEFTFSAGVAFYENPSDTMDLIYKADIKMYEAKRLGKNRYLVW